VRLVPGDNPEGWLLRIYGRRAQADLRGRDAIRVAPEVRLALEMAAHEEAERRALEGELHLLERAWREAEEIAAIADNLLLPASIHDRLRRLRGQRGERPD
jgi:hypothetical protein